MKLSDAVRLYIRDQKLQAVLERTDPGWVDVKAMLYNEHLEGSNPSWENYEAALFDAYEKASTYLKLSPLSEETIDFLSSNREKHRLTITDLVLGQDLL